ncbi:glycogen synthase GlgA [Pelotomaculum isophthalicicum JI]|uniref:Glycogen synthase n=1 Tax=Pelotomaculum isophthalicicum JI TaxID=947010 RepID=A0A9X4H6U9_9FIRM|nr:glycogen synthase GlgA [Pelotomaculum isophthalicicum]MDF9408759.1 glycogen synthase GlgA [Pelotomaculum isophthalicicum JI]
MRILYVISEADPFIKTGGLGEVGGSFPLALNKSGIEVRVIIPKYSQITPELTEKAAFLTSFEVPLGWRRQYCGLQELVYQDVHYYLIDNEYYFKRSHVYGEYDDAERFSFFCRAVLESICRFSDYKPDIIHCNDWHTALIPVMLKEFYFSDPLFFNMRTLLTIHNLKYQGIYPWQVYFDVLGLPEGGMCYQRFSFKDVINFLKAGILYADRITTVSPTYAGEILYPYYGEQMESVLAGKKDLLTGILNGIDYGKYNPRKDSYIYAQYGSYAQKLNNKLGLQEDLGLPVRPEAPLFGVISRLVPQKGFDLLLHVMPQIMEMDVQLVILGDGEAQYENSFQYYTRLNPDKIAFMDYYDEVMAHKIYAAADMVLMPSRFEPCGLTQMIAMRYGAIPIARETGGLKDSVIPYNQFTGTGNGFSFANYNAHELLDTIQRAVGVFHEQNDRWETLVNNAMHSDFSWERSAKQYTALYATLLEQLS